MNSYIHILVLLVFCSISNSISCSSLTCRSTCIKDLTNAAKANAVAISELEDTLSDLQEKSCNTNKKLGVVLNLVQELTLASSSCLPRSCAEIKQKMPQSSSGVFLIAISEEKTQYVYCRMDTLCDSDGGWTRLANIDMTDPNESCPGGLRLYNADGVRACGRPNSGGGSCHSVKYSSRGIEYTQVYAEELEATNTLHLMV